MPSLGGHEDSNFSQVLIERWLYNVESIINHNEALEDLSPQSASGIATGAPPIQWWKPEAEPLELVVGDFVGSGRRLRHCGVTNTVLDRLDHRPGSNPRRWRYDDEIQAYKDLATDFEKDLVKRPLSWCACWFCGWIFVSVGISMAIMISFTTGTVGMGCLALLWLIFWNISSVSWYFQAMFQEPPRMVRWVSTGVNSISFLLLLTIMILQVKIPPSIIPTWRWHLLTFIQTMGGLNSCLCKSSFFALGWGGYMDFEDATFHTKIYPHIRPSWITAAVIGPLGALTAIFWTFRRWQRSSELWKVDEETTDLLNPLRRPEDGEERQWRDGSDPVYWLI
jgi:hypothetical protein